jgi:hypothetical protein
MLNQKQSDLGIGQPTKNIESEFLGLGIRSLRIDQDFACRQAGQDQLPISREG